MFYTYLITNRSEASLYTGQCSDLVYRIDQHRNGQYSGFTSKYKIHRLMWYEIHDTRDLAFTRERQIKNWKRNWKNALINERNIGWTDLSMDLTEFDLYDPERMHKTTYERFLSGSLLSQG